VPDFIPEHHEEVLKLDPYRSQRFASSKTDRSHFQVLKFLVT
jgi:hypothetical protein